MDDTTVLVVGAGPVGLVAARLLGGAGHSCVVVERRPGPQRSPAAHVVNARTLEILRQAGVDMDAVHTIATDPLDAGHVNFVTRLSGTLIGRLPFERQGTDCLDHTPTPLRNISQHRLEPLLADEARRAGGVDLRYGWEWVEAVQDAEGVTSVVRDVATGEEHTIRSRHVLGADGAGSRVRKALGIEMIGPASIQSFLAIHVRADLRALVRERLGVLHFVMDPGVAGTFVAHDLDREWVFMTTYDPATETLDDFPPDRCAAMVRAAIGDVEVELDVEGVGSWHMTAQVAARYGSGRIHLVGDAAHRFPPTGGMGLNTGVADAHNLAWKIDAVERGWGGPGLLDTYEIERRPVAVVNCDQSTTNAVKIVLLVAALGDDPAAALADPDRRADVEAAVAEQATHFDMLGLQLGHVYAEGALHRTIDPSPEPVVDPSRFEPVARVGARLPHGWTTDGRSTLDLVEPGTLTLVTVGDHERWRAAIEHARAAAVGGPPVRQVRLGVDVEISAEWPDRTALGSQGALLVRPDQHIAWRSSSPDDADSVAAALVATTANATVAGVAGHTTGGH